jgi:enoyl-CoA hydratase
MSVKLITIDNPPLNTISAAVINHIWDELESLGDARAVLIQGAGGRAFSAGADITGFAGLGEDDNGRPKGIAPLAEFMESLDVPIVAGLEGYVLGGGLEIALACDVRIAAEETQLGFPEVSLGLLPGGGGTQRLPRLIGWGRAGWLIMSGERITSQQAYEWGLVEKVVSNGELEPLSWELARRLAALSPFAVGTIKRLLRETRSGPPDYEREFAAFVSCLASDDGQEGIAAFLEKRKPNWVGR